MPVTKKFEVNKYLEDFEEIDEYSPFSIPNYLEEEEILPEEKVRPHIPFWKRWKTILHSFLTQP